MNNILDHLKTVKSMERGHILGQMEKHIEGLGIMVKWKVWGNFIGQLVLYTKVNIKMIRDMVQGLWLGLYIKDIEVAGHMACGMGSANILK